MSSQKQKSADARTRAKGGRSRSRTPSELSARGNWEIAARKHRQRAKEALLAGNTEAFSPVKRLPSFQRSRAKVTLASINLPDPGDDDE